MLTQVAAPDSTDLSARVDVGDGRSGSGMMAAVPGFQMGQSAVVVPVPEADSAVGRWREELDPSARLGMPAHITTLFPFLPEAELDDVVVARLLTLCASTPVMEVGFRESGRFPGVLFLRLEPSSRLRALTTAVASCWPEAPPYGGEVTEVVPHLTVALTDDATSLDDAEAAVRGVLPFTARLTEARLYVFDGRRWCVRERLPFGDAPATADDDDERGAGRSSSAVETVASAIGRLPRGRRCLVGIDGRDGAGKTTFADALAQAVGRPVVRASCDDFHHPRAHRYQRGRDSPEGYYRDSFDLDALNDLLLRPFADGEPFVTRAFDHRTDQPVSPAAADAPADAVLILDGLFLHRPELRGRWDLSVLLDVPVDTAAARLQQRDGEPPRQRYLRGQELYFADADPAAHATLVIDW